MEWKYAWVDLIALVVAAFAFYKGYKRGLINQVVWFGSFVVGYLVASRFCHVVAEQLDMTIYNEEVTVAVVFVAILLAIILVMHIVARTISSILKPTIVGTANSILGGVFTSLISIVLMLVVMNLLLILVPELQDPMEKTWIVGRGAEFIDQLMERAPLDEIAERLEVHFTDLPSPFVAPESP